LDLARELAKRLEVPVEFVVFDAAGKCSRRCRRIAGMSRFLRSILRVRPKSPSPRLYVVIEATYLVRTESPLRTIEDVDRDGVRVAVGSKSAYDLYLSRTLKRAQLVRAPTSLAAIEMFSARKTRGGGRRQTSAGRVCKTHSDLRVIDGHFIGDRAGDGHAETQRGRRAIPAPVHRGDEKIGFIAKGSNTADKATQRWRRRRRINDSSPQELA